MLNTVYTFFTVWFSWRHYFRTILWNSRLPCHLTWSCWMGVTFSLSSWKETVFFAFQF